MTIERIETEAYYPFLNQAAKEKWSATPSPDSLAEILDLTENHPYYVNALCRQLWREEQPPTPEAVRHAWNQYVKKQSVWIIDDFSALTLNRKKTLLALASQPTTEPQGMAFTQHAGLPPSAVKKCIVDLLKMDIIYQDKSSRYKILDTAFAYFLRQPKT